MINVVVSMSHEDIQPTRAREAASTELSDNHDELHGFHDKKRRTLERIRLKSLF